MKKNNFTGLSKAENGQGYAVMNGRGHKVADYKKAEKYRKIRAKAKKA